MIVTYLIILFFLFEYSKAIIKILFGKFPIRFFIFYKITRENNINNEFIPFCTLGILINILTAIFIYNFSIYFFIGIIIHIYILKRLTEIIN